MTPRARNRLLLGLIAGLFLLPFGAAVVLRFGGWQPLHTRNHGELLSPPIELVNVQGLRDDGSRWAWHNTEHEWTLLVRIPRRCEAACRDALQPLPNVRQALGRHAERLHLFCVGDAGAATSLPSLRLQGRLPPPLAEPAAGELPELWLIDPHGYLVMRYPPGFDAGGLRRDLSRLLR